MPPSRLAVVSFCLLAPALALAQAAPPIVAVFRIEDKGAGLDERALDQLTAYLEAVVSEGGTYRIVPQAAIRNALVEKKQETYKECYDLKCQIELGRELAAEKSLATSVLRLGDTCTLTAALYDLRTQVTDATVKEDVRCDHDSLKKGIDRAAARLKAYRGGSAGGGFEEGRIGGGQGAWQVGKGKQVVVKFRSTPEPVMVMVDGKVLCERTPCSRTVAEGLHEVSMLSERYRERRERLSLAKGSEVEWDMRPNFGWLTVSSEPEGLEVLVNNDPVGRTPLVRKELAPGGYEVLVRSPCHVEAGERVVIELGREREVSVSLAERQAAIEVSARDLDGNDLEAEVRVDGVRLGETPDTFKVSICARALEVRHPEKGVKQVELALAEREVRPVAVVLEPAAPPPPPAGEDRRRPGGGEQPPAAAPVERSLFMGLRVNVAFDLAGAIRTSDSDWDEALFDAGTGMLTELVLDVKVMESLFIGVDMGFVYAKAASHQKTRDLALFDIGGRMGAIFALAEAVDLHLAMGIGASMLLTDLSGVRLNADGATPNPWRFEPGYVALHMRVEMGANWYIQDGLGLSFLAGVYFDLAGETVNLNDIDFLFDFGPLLYVGVGVLYAL